MESKRSWRVIKRLRSAALYAEDPMDSRLLREAADELERLVGATEKGKAAAERDAEPKTSGSDCSSGPPPGSNGALRAVLATRLDNKMEDMTVSFLR